MGRAEVIDHDHDLGMTVNAFFVLWDLKVEA